MFSIRLASLSLALDLIFGLRRAAAPVLAATPAATATPADFTVADALGRKVTFARPPQRIVVTGKALFMIADCLGSLLACYLVWCAGNSFFEWDDVASAA